MQDIPLQQNYNDWIKKNAIQKEGWKCEVIQPIQLETGNTLIDMKIKKLHNTIVKHIQMSLNSVLQDATQSYSQFQTNFNEIAVNTPMIIDSHIQSNCIEYEQSINEQIESYRSDYSKLQHLIEMADDTRTIEMSKAFEEYLNKWNTLRNKDNTDYNERFYKLKEIQKELTAKLKAYESMVNMKGYVISAVNRRDPKSITSIINGNKSTVMKLNFVPSTLIRLVYILVTNLSTDTKSRMEIVSACLRKVKEDKIYANEDARRVIQILAPIIREELTVQYKKRVIDNVQKLFDNLDEISAYYSEDNFGEFISPNPLIEQPDAYCVVVKNIPKYTKLEYFERIFKSIGKVINRIQITGGESSIWYTNLEDANKACKLNGRKIKNSNEQLRVYLLTNKDV